jgi:ectoine hydroxylase-related dioxygenase (phytanoyl-CoA dioxygenase family)
MYYKSHLAFAWYAELCCYPRILDVVESLLGPDILLWNSSFLPKAPHSKSRFTWHQDATYWGLEPAHVLSVWLALSHVTPESGCVRMLPGTHLGGQLPHENTFDPGVMLPRGQRVNLAVDEERAVDVVLNPGEASFHGVFTVHGSGPNETDDWRLGCNMTYLATHVRALNGVESALLVRGKDRYGHFYPESWPDGDLTAASLENHRIALDRMGTRQTEGETLAEEGRARDERYRAKASKCGK